MLERWNALSATRWIAVGTDALIGPKVYAGGKADEGIGPYREVGVGSGPNHEADEGFGPYREVDVGIGPYHEVDVGSGPWREAESDQAR